MTLVIVFACLGFAHWFGGSMSRVSGSLLGAYFGLVARVSQRLNLPPVVAYLLKLVIAGGIVAAIQWYLAGRGLLGWSAFSFVILLLAWGCRDLDRDVRDYLEADDESERNEAAQFILSNYRSPQSAEGKPAVIKGVFYQALVRWFGVLFWFLIAGAAGALVFRMVHSLLADHSNRGHMCESQVKLGRNVVAWIDLPPAVLVTLALAIVGNFDVVVAAWKKHFVDQQRSWRSWDYAFLPHVGCMAVMKGDSVEEAFSHDFDGNDAPVNLAMNLVWRSLVLWLTVIALLVINGTLN